MSSFTSQLVLQLPASTREDFEEMVVLEGALTETFAGLPHTVDGHDFGSGTANIFIHTDDPQAAFAIALDHYSPRERIVLKAAYRRFDRDDYTIIWPSGSQEKFRVI
jgi:hypothetical protein